MVVPITFVLIQILNKICPIQKVVMLIPIIGDIFCTRNVVKYIYKACNITYSDLALKKIKDIKNNKLDKLPIVVAKTQYSISDDPKKLGYPKDYEVVIKDVKLYNGAGFITVYLGNIITMPGLPKVPNYEHIGMDGDKIVGLS